MPGAADVERGTKPAHFFSRNLFRFIDHFGGLRQGLGEDFLAGELAHTDELERGVHKRRQPVVKRKAKRVVEWHLAKRTLRAEHDRLVRLEPLSQAGLLDIAPKRFAGDFKIQQQPLAAGSAVASRSSRDGFIAP